MGDLCFQKGIASPALQQKLIQDQFPIRENTMKAYRIFLGLRLRCYLRKMGGVVAGDFSTFLGIPPSLNL
ncbi:MAG: hypothetical protein AC479_06715 [miscellaneous Crenarchaeota group-6 archaeon AD8-1]|nr:MAG: hypothetical protein AC479_06715 [miscellaneous Crenarchaeota group-6 archaeon AD8-1]